MDYNAIQTPYFVYILLLSALILSGAIVRVRRARPIYLVTVPAAAAVLIVLAFAAQAALLQYIRNAPGAEYFGMNVEVLRMDEEQLLRAAAEFEKVCYLSAFRIKTEVLAAQAILLLSLLDMQLYSRRLKKGKVYAGRFSCGAAVFLALLLVFCIADRNFCLTPQLVAEDWDPRYEKIFVNDFYENDTAELPGGALAYGSAPEVSLGYASERLGDYIFYTSKKSVPLYTVPDGEKIGSIGRISYNELHGGIWLTNQKGWRYVAAADGEGFARTDDLLREFAKGQDHLGKGMYFRVSMMQEDRVVYNRSQWHIPTHDLMKSFYPFEYFVLIPAIAVLAILWIYQIKKKI